MMFVQCGMSCSGDWAFSHILGTALESSTRVRLYLPITHNLKQIGNIYIK